jgi:hypothetical protein
LAKAREDTPEFYSAFRRSVEYNPQTGEFKTVFPTTRVAAGARLGTVRADGTYIVSYDGKMYTASKLAYYWMTGRWPRRTVKLKQKDRKISDYRWTNLELSGPVLPGR